MEINSEGAGASVNWRRKLLGRAKHYHQLFFVSTFVSIDS